MLACEAAWLAGDQAAAVRVGQQALAEAVRVGSVGWQEQLAGWLARCGDDIDVTGMQHPHAVLARGDWQHAAEHWRRAGYCYEQAVALTEADRPDAVLEGLRLLDELGGVRLANVVRARLRRQGTPAVPSGPMAATREHAAGLTPRQAEVLALVVAGWTNAAIAQRLVLSVRTVDHYVEAVLRKLGVGSRAEAAAIAREQGLRAPVMGTPPA